VNTVLTVRPKQDPSRQAHGDHWGTTVADCSPLNSGIRLPFAQGKLSNQVQLPTLVDRDHPLACTCRPTCPATLAARLAASGKPDGPRPITGGAASPRHVIEDRMARSFSRPRPAGVRHPSDWPDAVLAGWGQCAAQMRCCHAGLGV